MMVKQFCGRTYRGGVVAVCLGMGLLLALTLLVVRPAHAGGEVGDGTPESCIESAFATVFATPGEVTFNCGSDPVVITLTVRYNVVSEATIDGGGLVTLHGSNTGGMFLIDSGETLTLTQITLTGGRYHDHGAIENFGTFRAIQATFAEMNVQPGSTSHSPFLWNLGTAELHDSVVRDSVNFDDGGGSTQVIYNATGAGQNATLLVENSQFITNNGGAISSQFNGQVTVIDSTFQGNYGRNPGLLLDNSTADSWAMISGSLFVDNDATIASGQGAAVALGNVGSVAITNTQFMSNTASGSGGAIIANGQGDVTVVDSTFVGNSSNGGGAIYRGSGGDLTVTGGEFSGNNSLSYGGAIASSASPVVISGATFDANTAASDGGAIFAGGGTNASLNDSQFTGNTAGAGGGAIYMSIGNLGLVRSVLTNNQAPAGAGGALYLGNASYNIYESVLANNQASDQGGGLRSFALGTSGTIRNSTFSGNSAGISGGNLYHDIGTLNITNATFVGGPGGNLAAVGGTVTAVNTVVTGGGTCSTPLTSQGHNLENGNSCGFNQSGDLIDTDPLLGPLQDNGGNTLTHLPAANSLALENGDDTACPDTDQRGVARPQNAVCDVGAVEAEPGSAEEWFLYLPVVTHN
jgi:predicted outer membrane repeat protein